MFVRSEEALNIDYSYHIGYQRDSYYVHLKGFKAGKQCCLWVEQELTDFKELAKMFQIFLF